MSLKILFKNFCFLFIKEKKYDILYSQNIGKKNKIRLRYKNDDIGYIKIFVEKM